MPKLHPASKQFFYELLGMVLGIYVGWLAPHWIKIAWLVLIALIVIFVLYVDLLWERVARWRR